MNLSFSNLSFSDFAVCVLIAVATVTMINLAVAAVRDHGSRPQYRRARRDDQPQERRAA